MTAPQLTPQEAAFVDCQFLTLAATQSTSVFFSVMGASVVMVAIAAQKTAILPLLLWLGLVAASQLFRTRIEIAPERRKAETAPGQHLHQNVRIAVLCGTVQALCLLSFPELGVSERTLLTLIYLGLATGAVAQSAGRHSTYIAYCAPFWIPLALLWMFSPSADYSAWTGLTVGLLIIGASTTMLVGYAKHAWHLFQESCAIRFRERELNERLQRALSEAEQASRAKTRFLAAASHDLRQPLHALSLLSATLGLRPLDARSQEVVGMMNRVLASLSGQLDGLLDISKLDAGVMEVHLQNMPVSLLLTQHFNELAPLARQKGLEAELDCQLRHEQICTDPGLVLRILRNLTQNALKFTTQGKISLRARAQAGDVLIEVADTGCGIDELHHELVFEEFFQLSNQARDPGHGLGLGLSIVRRLTDLLGIDLTMQSTVHLGTTFTLRLPLAATTENR